MASLGLSVILASCNLNEVDNYPGPNASIAGGIYDKETGQLIEQDIIRGAQIEYVEQGFSNPEVQYMVFKNDGTYQNKLMFANSYTIRPVRGNFVPLAEEKIIVTGDMIHDFKAQPYIRIKNTSISQQGDKVVGSFQIQSTVANPVKRVSLFVHTEANVGDPLNLIATGMDINAQTEETTLYKLEIDLGAYAAKLKKGSAYYFRIGALIDAAEAKYNYAPAQRITIK